jgi:hypothetical protein
MVPDPKTTFFLARGMVGSPLAVDFDRMEPVDIVRDNDTG